MRRRFSLPPLAAAVVAALVLPALGESGSTRERATLASVVDGDTIALTTGTRVRLLQIDTPEVGSGECYSRAAARELRRLLPPGARVVLEADPELDAVDDHGRLLRYVVRNGQNVNVELVRRGAATVWFYGGERGRYATTLLAAAQQARRERRGLWGACRAVWNPLGPAVTTPKGRTLRSSCDASYPGVCIPSPPPDLDCRDVTHSGFRVVDPDPHRFDRDGDGLGCE